MSVATEEKVQASKGAAIDEQIVVFNLGSELFGINIASIQEIVHWQTITMVPKSPSFVEGVMNLRGKIIPVVDLRRCFGLETVDRGKESRIVVVEIGGWTVGVIVDGVSEVVHLGEAEIEPPSPVVTTIESSYLKGIARMGERLILLLSLENVLSPVTETA